MVLLLVVTFSVCEHYASTSVQNKAEALLSVLLCLIAFVLLALSEFVAYRAYKGLKADSGSHDPDEAFEMRMHAYEQHRWRQRSLATSSISAVR